MKLTKKQQKQADYLEEHGCSVYVGCDKYIEVENYTKADGDQIISICDSDTKTIKKSLKEYIDNYDINEQVVACWPNGHKADFGGLPFNNIKEHYEDLEDWVNSMKEIVNGMPDD